jgi:MFS family permease
MTLFNMINALIQTHVSDELRGRVMGIYTISFFGVMPVSALLAGGVAEVAGEPIAVALGALVTLIFAVWLWARMPQLRALE